MNHTVSCFVFIIKYLEIHSIQIMINYDNLAFFKGNMFYFIFFISVLQFVVILESVLAKLSRYDEGTLFSSFLSFTVRTNSGWIY